MPLIHFFFIRIVKIPESPENVTIRRLALISILTYLQIQKLLSD